MEGVRGPMLALCLIAASAACGGQDVVATASERPDAGGAPSYCDGDGPPILVGDGITVGEGNGSSDDVCSGEVAVRTFRHALCTCEGYAVSVRLDTDSFDSAEAPYAPGGTAGPVGINGPLQTSDDLVIGGDLTVASTAGFALGDAAQVAGDLASAGPLGVDVAVTVGGDARVAGSIDLTSLDVAGTLTVPNGQTIDAPTLSTGSTVRAPVVVEPPCACEPEDLVDIGDFVASHRIANENDLIDLSIDALVDYTTDTTLELPCGRFYVIGPVTGMGSLTLRVTGRAVLLVDGDMTLTGPFVIELVGEDAELDLMIGGILRSNSSINAGDPEHPSRTRIYVGGNDTILLSGDSQLAGNLYAPLAEVSMSGTATVYGSLFVRRLVQSAPVTIHYDVDVLDANAGCF